MPNNNIPLTHHRYISFNDVLDIKIYLIIHSLDLTQLKH